ARRHLDRPQRQRRDGGREGTRGDASAQFRPSRGESDRRRSEGLHAPVDGHAASANRRPRRADRRDLPRERTVREAHRRSSVGTEKIGSSEMSRFNAKTYRGSGMSTALRAALFSLPASVLAPEPPAHAHHSFAAEYDASKPIKLAGKVTKIEWPNPTISIHMDANAEKTHAV